MLLLTRFRLRARSATLASLALANHSEFGLSVGALAVNKGWLLLIDPGDVDIAILGMDRVGSGAYKLMRERQGDVVVGIGVNVEVVRGHQEAGPRVFLGDATDSDFWQRIHLRKTCRLVLLAMEDHGANLDAAKRLAAGDFKGLVAATAQFDDQVTELNQVGVAAFDIYAEEAPGLPSMRVSGWTRETRRIISLAHRPSAGPRPSPLLVSADAFGRLVTVVDACGPAGPRPRAVVNVSIDNLAGTADVFQAEPENTGDLTRWVAHPVMTLSRPNMTEDDPAISDDGTVVIFDRGVVGLGKELWMASRESPDSPLSDPRRMTGITSRWNDSGALLFRPPGSDQTELYFSSTRTDDVGRIYRATCTR